MATINLNIPDSKPELVERELRAERRLAKVGLCEQAREWLKQNPPPQYWRGTPLEYAELEMILL